MTLLFMRNYEFLATLNVSLILLQKLQNLLCVSTTIIQGSLEAKIQ